MVKLDFGPFELPGIWTKGYVLDYHIIPGYKASIKEPYKRTELGDLLYQLKYKEDTDKLNWRLNQIVEKVFYFIKFNWQIDKQLDAIIPMPPSNLSRKFQPVFKIAEKLGEKLKIPVYNNLFIKKPTLQLKNINDHKKRIEILKRSLNIKPEASRILYNSNILILDDIYRSGDSLTAITEKIISHCQTKNIYVLTITKTQPRNENKT